MEFVIVILIVVAVLTAMYSSSMDKTKRAYGSRNDWVKEVSSQLALTEFADDQRQSLGVNVARKKLAIIERDGSGIWVEFDRIAHIEIIPLYSTYHESTGQTSTRRGSQLFGAGIGAAIAGPAGLIVGGLSGKTETVTRGSSRESLTSLELKLRLRSEELPFVKMTFDWLNSDEVERIAARVANSLDQTSPVADLEKQAFQRFSVAPRPTMRAGWWTRTFG